MATPRAAPSSGDREGFERFVRSTEHGLHGLAYLLCGQHQEAQDLVQEAFARAWQNWGRVSAYDDPAGWTRRVLHNLAVSSWRRRRHPAADRPAGLEPAGAHAAPPDVGHLAVADALSRLPVRQRVAVVLHAIGDLTVPEVAAEMQVPEGSVRGWLSRARASLAVDLGLDAARQPGAAR